MLCAWRRRCSPSPAQPRISLPRYPLFRTTVEMGAEGGSVLPHTHARERARAPLQDQPPQAFFGVYDGHGGVEAAAFAASQIHGNVMASADMATDVRKLWHMVSAAPCVLCCAGFLCTPPPAEGFAPAHPLLSVLPRASLTLSRCLFLRLAFMIYPATPSFHQGV